MVKIQGLEEAAWAEVGRAAHALHTWRAGLRAARPSREAPKGRTRAGRGDRVTDGLAQGQRPGSEAKVGTGGGGPRVPL